MVRWFGPRRASPPSPRFPQGRAASPRAGFPSATQLVRFCYWTRCYSTECVASTLATVLFAKIVDATTSRGLLPLGALRFLLPPWANKQSVVAQQFQWLGGVGGGFGGGMAVRPQGLQWDKPLRNLGYCSGRLIGPATAPVGQRGQHLSARGVHRSARGAHRGGAF
jgi:hypothetical protein